MVALGWQFLHNPNLTLDAAEKLGIETPFAQFSPVYGYWLEKRARTNLGKLPTRQQGILLGSDESV